MICTLLAARDIKDRHSGERLAGAGELFTVRSIRWASVLVRCGAAVPNDARTAEAVELARRLGSVEWH